VKDHDPGERWTHDYPSLVSGKFPSPDKGQRAQAEPGIMILVTLSKDNVGTLKAWKGEKNDVIYMRLVC
jgi:hypothetical protein